MYTPTSVSDSHSSTMKVMDMISNPQLVVCAITARPLIEWSKTHSFMTVVRCSLSEVYEVYVSGNYALRNHVENLNSTFNPDIVVSIVGNRHDTTRDISFWLQIPAASITETRQLVSRLLLT